MTTRILERERRTPVEQREIWTIAQTQRPNASLSRIPHLDAHSHKKSITPADGKLREQHTLHSIQKILAAKLCWTESSTPRHRSGKMPTNASKPPRPGRGALTHTRPSRPQGRHTLTHLHTYHRQNAMIQLIPAHITRPSHTR
ncbi:hypothetical protein M758_1G281400 [Ceratodon purpureus]|nr:hypothetical protein M758_1G281400 [Ceratodon purpureus]